MRVYVLISGAGWDIDHMKIRGVFSSIELAEEAELNLWKEAWAEEKSIDFVNLYEAQEQLSPENIWTEIHPFNIDNSKDDCDGN